MDYRLCYVEGSFAYFTDADPTEVYGDDWNDAPHDCNAGDPYRDRGWCFAKVAFDGPHDIVGTCAPTSTGEGIGQWGYLSVDAINRGEAPWLVVDNYSSPRRCQHVIHAGVTITEFKRLIAAAGGNVYVAHS
jgi:hypothetical protein